MKLMMLSLGELEVKTLDEGYSAPKIESVLKYIQGQGFYVGEGSRIRADEGSLTLFNIGRRVGEELHYVATIGEIV